MRNIRIAWREPAGSPQPVRIPLTREEEDASSWHLVEVTSGTRYPVQREGDRAGVALLPIEAGSREYRLEAGESPGVRVSTHLRGLDELEIRIRGELFTIYHCSDELARPYLHPVLLPGGLAVTRGFPMENIEGEARDHPHHRSLWSAYGEVSGTDNWSEAAGKHAWIKHQAFDRIVEGPVFGGFESSGVWTSPGGSPILRETRRVTVYEAGEDRRLLDYELSLTPEEGEVHYGDTKEGGLLSVRVATSMDGNKGGRIQNSEGGVGEKECWGRPARWCDYSGPVQGRTVGIAVLDHPSNFRSPVRWHARDYGLMTTNCFGTSTFEGESGGTRGEYRQKPEETLRFRYRVLIHHGGAEEGAVAETWNAFAREPEIEG
jgi:methane monooxygenase PmoA-like